MNKLKKYFKTYNAKIKIKFLNKFVLVDIGIIKYYKF